MVVIGLGGTNVGLGTSNNATATLNKVSLVASITWAITVALENDKFSTCSKLKFNCTIVTGSLRSLQICPRIPVYIPGRLRIPFSIFGIFFDVHGVCGRTPPCGCRAFGAEQSARSLVCACDGPAPRLLGRRTARCVCRVSRLSPNP